MVAIHSPVPKFGVEPNYDFFRSRFSTIAKFMTAAGALKALGYNSNGRYGITTADGDKYQMFFICDGTETLLEITNRKASSEGIFDLYVNGVLDSSGYDDYAAVSADVNREITLTQPVRIGMNTIELRVNGKNVAASEYRVAVYGASLQ